MKKLTIALLTMLTILVSCKKDNSNKNPNNSSRTLRYEVTGNFTGTTLYASYTTATGSTANDPITLPWTKEIDFAKSVTAATIVMSGSGGVAGQKVTVVTKRGGTQVGAPFEIVAEASGSFSQPAPVVVF